jgi:predicted PurR-regulated permease PerM
VERSLETLRDKLAALRGFRADAPEFQVALREATSAFHRFEQQLLGGPVTARLKQLANPGPEEAQQYGQEFATLLGPLALRTPQVLGGLLIKFIIGSAVMIVSLYFFLADGPAITHAVMRLSPLDDRYEEQLLNEFVKLSRAVVLSTLLSAFVQGALSGIGYYFAGIPSVFLMTVLTMVFAMIPFVGAAAGWLSCSLWLAFYAGHPGAGIGLAIFGLLIVSLADNVVKPLVLHGQSNLHPLLALLSVLGGVTALGPIGIFVGPMAVAFLQALLVMLQTELQSLSAGATAPGSTAVEVSAAGSAAKTR